MAVVDSSVLIPLSKINKLSLLKRYFSSILITQDVRTEVSTGTGASEIELACKNWIKVENPKNRKEVSRISKLEDIEKADASVIILAKEKRKILLSNDYALIMVARSKGVECWWLTTFLLRCLKKKIITKMEAKQILFLLVESGMNLDNAIYAAILREIENI